MHKVTKEARQKKHYQNRERQTKEVKVFMSKCTALTNMHCVQRCFTTRSDRWPPLLWFPPNLRHISASEHASGPSQLSPLSPRFSPLHTAVLLGSLTQTRSGDRTGKWDVKHLLFLDGYELKSPQSTTWKWRDQHTWMLIQFILYIL